MNGLLNDNKTTIIKNLNHVTTLGMQILITSADTCVNVHDMPTMLIS
jgi:hypothetical protein